MSAWVFVGCMSAGLAVSLFVTAIEGWRARPVRRLVSRVRAMGRRGLLPYRSRATWSVSRRETARMQEQMEGVAVMLCGLAHAGLGPDQSIVAVTSELPHPIGEEFRAIVARHRAGRTMGESLAEAGIRTGLDAFNRLAMIAVVCSQTGASPAPMFEVLADRLRDDGEMRRELTSRTAELRFSAGCLIVLPWILITVSAMTNGPAVVSTLVHPGGRTVLFLSLVAWLAGVYWMRRIVDPWRLSRGV